MRRPLLEVNREADDGRIVLAVSGEVDLATVGVLRDALAQAASDGGEVWVDLSAVEFIDSTGLTALMTSHQAIDHGGLTIICPTDGAVRRTLEVSGLHEVLHVVTRRGAGG